MDDSNGGPVGRPIDKADHSRLPELDSTRISILWEMWRFDGPLNGLALYEGRKVWFDWHHEDEDTHYFYTLYPLTDAQAAEAELWWATRGTYEGKGWIGRDTARHDTRYNGPTFKGVEPLGWFRDGRNPNFYGVVVVPAPDQEQ